MKILIIGANGQTGKEVTAKALEQGHNIVAYVRRPETLEEQIGLEIVKGQLTDVDILASAMQNVDAVLCCLGPAVSISAFIKTHNLMQTAVENAVSAMNTAGVNRFILLSAFGVGESINTANLSFRVLIKMMLKKIYEDKEKSEELLRKSNIDWSTIYPVFLNDNVQAGNAEVNYVDQTEKVIGMPKVTRSDVAQIMIDVIRDEKTVKKGLLVSSKDTIRKKI